MLFEVILEAITWLTWQPNVMDSEPIRGKNNPQTFPVSSIMRKSISTKSDGVFL